MATKESITGRRADQNNHYLHDIDGAFVESMGAKS